LYRAVGSGKVHSTHFYHETHLSYKSVFGGVSVPPGAAGVFGVAGAVPSGAAPVLKWNAIT
jgi:hypothetical protein